MIVSHFVFRYLRRFRRFPLGWWLMVLTVAGLTGVLVTATVSNAAATASKYDEQVEVFVATHSIEPGTTLQPGDVAKQTRPAAFSPQMRVTANPVGRTALEGIQTNEVLTTRDVARMGTSPTAALLAGNERAVAVPVDDKSLSLDIGDEVSIISSPDGSDPASSSQAEEIVARARVVHVTESAVTLAVGDDEVTNLAQALTTRAITLALTNLE